MWVTVSMFAPPGARCDCEVQTVEQNKTLTYTWDTKDLKSVVTWTLTPAGTGTHLRMEQSGFRADQSAYPGATVGWPQFLAALEQVWRGSIEVCRRNSKQALSWAPRM